MVFMPPCTNTNGDLLSEYGRIGFLSWNRLEHQHSDCSDPPAALFMLKKNLRFLSSRSLNIGLMDVCGCLFVNKTEGSWPWKRVTFSQCFQNQISNPNLDQ